MTHWAGYRVHTVDITLGNLVKHFRAPPPVAPFALQALAPLRTAAAPKQGRTWVPLEVDTEGKGPEGPKRVGTGADVHPDSYIKYAVAKEVRPGLALPVEFCDPTMGHQKKHDVLPEYIEGNLTVHNVLDLCALALQRIQIAARLPPHHPAHTAADSLGLRMMIFIEEVITLTEKEDLGPEALTCVLELVSYLTFSSPTPSVLLDQHRSLAARLDWAIYESNARHPEEVTVDVIIRLSEAHVRASDVLEIGPVQSGLTLGLRMKQLYQVYNYAVASPTPHQALRQVVAWAALQRRFTGFSPCNYELGFLLATVRGGLGDLIPTQLEEAAGAVEGLKRLRPSTSLPFLEAICREAVDRASRGECLAAAAAAVLGVAHHSAYMLPGSDRHKLSDDISAWMYLHGMYM